MHLKNNRLTYRRDEVEQKMYEANPVNSLHINKLEEHTEQLKRAYTIVASKSNEHKHEHDLVDLADYSIEQAPHINQYSDMNVPEQEQPDAWPSVEELETLIRAERQEVIGNDPEQQHKQVNLAVDPPPPFYEELTFPIAEEKQMTITQSVSWTKVLTAVASSIVTGILIGYVLLLAVYGVNVWPVNMISKQLSEETEPATTELVATEQTIQNTNPDDAIASVALPEVERTVIIQPMQTFTYTALQAGVFTKDDTKQALIDTLQKRGYPATSIKTEDGKTVVFAGIASSKETTYQTNHMTGVELYRKSFSVHIPQLSADQQLEGELQQWMFDVHALMKSYMLMSEAQFEQSTFSAIYSDTYKLLEEKYSTLLEETKLVESKVEEESIKDYVAFHTDKLTAIHQAFADYQQKPSAAILFDIQQQLLAIIAYQVEWSQN